MALRSENSIRLGRPATSLLHRLRVIIWSHHVQASSKALTSDDFEIDYLGGSRKSRTSSGQWARYLRGNVLPKGGLIAQDSNLVFRLDALFPGTAQTFYHPIWDLIDFQRPMGLAQLLEMISRCPTSVGKAFLPKGSTAATATGHFKFKSAGIQSLTTPPSGTSYDKMAYFLLHARFAHLQQDEEWFEKSILSLHQQIAKLTLADSKKPWSYGTLAWLCIDLMCYLRLIQMRYSIKDPLTDVYALLDGKSPPKPVLGYAQTDPKMSAVQQANVQLILFWRENWIQSVLLQLKQLPKVPRTRLTSWITEIDEMPPEW